MNIRSTNPADLPARRAFSVADVERMVELGIIHHDERIELVDGELLRMSPKGNRHEILKVALLEYWADKRLTDIRIAPETTYRLAADTYLEPDLLVYRKPGLKSLKGPGALLAVEIADSSLGYDLGAKAAVFARFGVPELWVIDAVRMAIHVHREPGPEGYGIITKVGSDETVVPKLVPAFALRLAGLDLEGDVAP